MSIAKIIGSINNELPQGVRLVAVSKFHPAEAVAEAYNAGQRVFAESRPQEFAAKYAELPKDIEWHFIGHLQTNKLKLVLPYVSLVQSVDSLRLLEAINAWALANNKQINVLLEMHIAAEDSKQGFSADEIIAILGNAESYSGLKFCGLMGMATFTDEKAVIRADFEKIKTLMDTIKTDFPELVHFKELSIGMSDDYPIALEYGATLVRIGTKIFGHRN